MYPALKLMFAEHYEEMELRALKRQLQKEREMARSSLQILLKNKQTCMYSKYKYFCN